MIRRKVLLVDDVAPLRQFVAMFFDRSEDFEVVAQAADAEQGLHAAVEHRPDAVLLDVNMPGRSGIDVLPELREALPQAVVVIFSGFESVAIAEQAKRLGADAYIEKGTPAAELLDRLRELFADRPV